MASGRQVEYSLRLNSNASATLMADSAAANKFDNSMWQVQKTLASFGLGLGAHYLIDAAKDWTQAAADYEQAMLRIKNASKTEDIGLFNEGFINSQVDKFKLKLQETTDAYGNFLFKIKNANLSNDVANRLFENLSVVGKIGGIPQEQMDATVRNVGILLGEGVLEARHLRQLSYVHPQIVPFIADALGIKNDQKDEFSALFKQNIDDETAQQKLSQLISSGKLTKLGLNSNVIIEAFEKYRESIETKLPETLDLVQSKLNSLSVTWDRFKNSLILGQKPELAQLFSDLEKDIHWLTEHEEQIIRVGKAIFNIVEAYAAWRLSLIAISGINGGVLGFFTNEQERLSSALNRTKISTEENTIANTKFSESELEVSYASENLAEHYAIQRDLHIKNAETILLEIEELDKLKLSLEQVSVQMDLFPSEGSLFTSTQLEMAGAITTVTDALALQNEQLEIQSRLNEENIAAGRAHGLISDQRLASQQAALDEEGAAYDAKLAAGAGYAAGRTGVGSLLSGAVMPVMITWIANDVLNAMFPNNKDDWDSKDRNNFLGINFSSGDYNDKYENMIRSGYIDFNHPIFNGVAYSDAVWMSPEEFANRTRWQSNGTSDSDAWDYRNYIGDIYSDDPNKGKGSTTASKKPNIPKLPEHHIRGNSSNYFTVNIHELNGIKQMEVKEGNKQDVENIKQIVGIELTRNMLEIINDIQVVRNGH